MFCLSLPIWYSPITLCKFLQNLSARQHLAFFERVSLSLWATRLRHKRSRLFRHTTGSVTQMLSGLTLYTCTCTYNDLFM